MSLQPRTAKQEQHPLFASHQGLNQGSADSLALIARGYCQGSQLPAAVPVGFNLANADELPRALDNKEVGPIQAKGPQAGASDDTADGRLVRRGSRANVECHTAGNYKVFNTASAA